MRKEKKTGMFYSFGCSVVGRVPNSWNNNRQLPIIRRQILWLCSVFIRRTTVWRYILPTCIRMVTSSEHVSPYLVYICTVFHSKSFWLHHLLVAELSGLNSARFISFMTGSWPALLSGHRYWDFTERKGDCILTVPTLLHLVCCR
jgi:hypothetical protein